MRLCHHGYRLPRLKSTAAPPGLGLHFFNFSQGSAALHPGLTSVAPPGLHALPKPKVQYDFAIMDTGSPGSNPLPPSGACPPFLQLFPGFRCASPWANLDRPSGAGDSLLYARIDSVLPDFTNRQQWIFGSGAGGNPFLFAANNIQQQFLVCRSGQPAIQLLAVFFLFQRLAGFGMEEL